jgi:hypothetical protein
MKIENSSEGGTRYQGAWDLLGINLFIPASISGNQKVTLTSDV